MTLVNAMDIVIAQTEKAIQANAKERTLALEDGDIVQYERMERCSRRLNSLHSKLIVARAEVTDLSIHGCKAVFTELEELS